MSEDQVRIDALKTFQRLIEHALIMRSRSWLISAWKPKLSEAIFEREGS